LAAAERASARRSKHNVGVLAQQGLDLPLTIPWYIGVAMVAVWLALVAGAVALTRRVLRERAARRQAESRSKRSLRGGPPARR
jgi:hypothetical protein